MGLLDLVLFCAWIVAGIELVWTLEWDEFTYDGSWLGDDGVASRVFVGRAAAALVGTADHQFGVEFDGLGGALLDGLDDGTHHALHLDQQTYGHAHRHCADTNLQPAVTHGGCGQCQAPEKQQRRHRFEIGG